MKSLPFIRELTEARMFYGVKDIKGMSADKIAQIVFLMFMMLEVIRHYKPNYTADYARDTLKYNTYDNMHYSGSDLGNLLAVLNNQDTFEKDIKTHTGVSIPLFQINRYLGQLTSKATSKSAHNDDVTFFWRLEDYLKLSSESLLRQLRRDIGNWDDLHLADKQQIYLILRREFDKRCSSVDMYLWYKSSFKITEGEMPEYQEEKPAVNEEQETERLDITEKGDWNVRVFLDAYLTNSAKNWIDRIGEGKVNRGSATLDLDNSSGVAYINRIDATPTGEGFGSELLKYIVEQSKAHGYYIVKAYTEWTNLNSKDMFKKAGFRSVDHNNNGNYWELDL